MSVLEWQMDIYHKLRDGLPNTRVFLEGVPESSMTALDPTGLIKPLVIIWFGQLTDVTTFSGSVSGLCGTEGGEGLVKQGNFLVESVAPTGLSLLQLEAVVRSLLTGFRPAGEGELSEGGQATVRDPMPLGIGDTLRFYKPLFFNGVLTVMPLQMGS